jgi:hypothetical protein
MRLQLNPLHKRIFVIHVLRERHEKHRLRRPIQAPSRELRVPHDAIAGMCVCSRISLGYALPNEVRYGSEIGKSCGKSAGRVAGLFVVPAIGKAMRPGVPAGRPICPAPIMPVFLSAP